MWLRRTHYRKSFGIFNIVITLFVFYMWNKTVDIKDSCSLRKGVWSRKTSLTPPLFIEVRRGRRACDCMVHL
jgi:hypothetical protein